MCTLTSRLVELFLFGDRGSLLRGQALPQEHCVALTRFRRAWHVVTASAALPRRASVTTIGALLWSDTGANGDAVAHRIESHLFNVRQDPACGRAEQG